MPQSDVNTITAQLKKGELSNIYYIYGKNIIAVEKLTQLIIKTAIGDNTEFALTKLDGKTLNFSELSDTIQVLPMMAEYNCILINDYNCERPKENMQGATAENLNKKFIDVLKEVPPQTIVIINVTGFAIETKSDYKTGKTIIKDKNKKLGDFAAKYGISCECPILSRQELSKNIMFNVKEKGCIISFECAKEIVELCNSDAVIIENEVAKLCDYAVNREITKEMIYLMIHQNQDVNVFSVADYIIRRDKKSAFLAVNNLMVNKDNRGSVIASITNSFIDLYRAMCALNSGKNINNVTNDYSYAWEFKVKNAFRDSSRMNKKHVRNCIKILRDSAVTLNSTSIDEKIVIEQMITKMFITE